MRRLGLLLLSSILAAPPSARADGSVQIDLGAGVGLPFGQVEGGSNLGDLVAYAFPLQADVQFRFLRQFAAGPYVRYAPTSLASTLQNGCSGAGISCDASDLGFGVLGEYRFSERLEGGPWFGALIGWELLKSTQAAAGQKSTATLSGLELGLRGGMDFELGAITLGPWAALQASQFTNSQVESNGTTSSGSIVSTAVHAWFEVGVRLSLLL